MNEGWIKIYYKMLDWEWIDDPYVVSLWLRILLSTNVKDKKWRGQTIKRGQWLTSIHSIADQTGWSRNTVKRMIRILENSNQITTETDLNGIIITVVNFGKYQTKNGSINDLSSVKSGSMNDPLNNNSRSVNDPQADPLPDPPTGSANDPNLRYIEDKNIRREDNIKNKKLRAGENLGIFENVKLSDIDIERIRMNFAAEGLDDNFILRCIDKLSSFLHEGNGSHYKSHAAAITLWVKTSVLEDDRRTGKAQQRYQQQTQPSSMQLTEDEKRQIWARLSEKDKQEYLDTHDGLTPWQYDEQHGTN